MGGPLFWVGGGKWEWMGHYFGWVAMSEGRCTV